LSDVSWAKAHYIANIYYQKFNKIHYSILSTDSILVCNKKIINEKIITHYVNSKVWYENFNSYNIYENDAVLIKHVNGSYLNLMGIPIKDIITSLNNIGYLKLFRYYKDDLALQQDTWRFLFL